MARAKKKTCSHCKEEKPLTEFHLNRATADGFAYYCKPCALAAGAASAKRVAKKKRPKVRGKVCIGCKERLPRSSFGPQPRAADGLRSRCNTCLALQKKDSVQGRDLVATANAALAITNGGAEGGIAPLVNTGLVPLINRITAAMRAGNVQRLVLDLASAEFEMTWTKKEAGALPAEEKN